jgi:hypothetical protein
MWNLVTSWKRLVFSLSMAPLCERSKFQLLELLNWGHFVILRDSKHLTDMELPGEIESIQLYAFIRCPNLRRIAIPLQDNMFHLASDPPRFTQFNQFKNLTTVDLVGGIHKTISSLLLESWRDEILQEIDRINQGASRHSCRRQD